MNEPTGRPLVLCVDDDPIALELLAGVLAQAGYDVRSASSGAAALESVRERKPDIVLLDVTMPGMSGIEVCARLVDPGCCPDVPVVFQTARREVEDKRELLAAGAVGYILKPFERQELLAKVEQHLASRTRWESLWKWRDLSRTRVRRSEFPRFKTFLEGAIPDRGGAHRAIADAGATEIYELAATLRVSPQQMARWTAEFLELPYLEQVGHEAIELEVLPPSFCRANCVLALAEADTFVVSNPFDWQVVASLLDLERTTDALKVFVTEPANIRGLFRREEDDRRDTGHSVPELVERLRAGVEGRSSTTAPELGDGPIIQLVNRLIDEAYAAGASDLHIEPLEDGIVMRFRIDGDLRVVHHVEPLSLIRPIVSRIKIMCGLDISERRLPQDGRIVYREFSDRGADFDLRVSTAPMQHGEKVVLRIVDKAKSVMPLSELGFSTRNLELYREKIRSPYGMILHVGPTGSGKSMTLYAALNEIQRPEINIQTAEDPIEYSIPGINQLQVNPGIGLSFTRALRCYLRQDPDIILLGEIRDLETARTAVEASLTGHLLLSTLHTNDAPSTVTRLIQMGIEPFMVSSSVVLICAQRLVRRLCPKCKTEFTPDANERRLVGLDSGATEVTLWRARGCDRCGGIGYRGRVGVHELLVPNDSLRLAINEPRATAERLREVAVAECGLTTLWWDAVEKVRAGLTSLDDVLAKVRWDDFDTRPKWLCSDLGKPLANE